ncbi:MAG: nitroreductase family protein [Anaerovoracaceae bacterium]
MKRTFLEAVINRRTIYDISGERPISDERLKEIMEMVILHTPSAFNSQTSRTVLLLDDHHRRLWSIVLETLRQRTDPAKFKNTEEKIAGFAAGYGTLLFFEELTIVQDLQERFPRYKDSFPIWSEHSSAILQFAVWTALSDEGLGASLQHYNPIIDDQVKETWKLPRSWKLIAQMPFGKLVTAAGEKEFANMEDRLKIFR